MAGNCAGLARCPPSSRCSNPHLWHIAVLTALCDRMPRSPTASGRRQFLPVCRRYGSLTTGGFFSPVIGVASCPLHCRGRSANTPCWWRRTNIGANARGRQYAMPMAYFALLKKHFGTIFLRPINPAGACSCMMRDSTCCRFLASMTRLRSLGEAGTTPEICRPARLRALPGFVRCSRGHATTSMNC